MSALETKKKTSKKSLIDPLYQKFMKSVTRSIGSSEFYEFFMDAVSRADNEFQFSNRRMEKIIDLKWVNAIEATIPAMQAIIANPRNIIREDELIVNVAHAKKGGSDVVRHLAQHGQLVDNFDEETGEVRPNKLMQKYREDSEELYENRLAFTVIENAHHFVRIRHDALMESMGDEFGAKLKTETRLETAVEEMYVSSFIHVKHKDSALETDEKNGDVLGRIARLNRLLTVFMNSPYALQMQKLNRVKGRVIKTNVLKKNPHYKKMTDLYEFLRMYDEVGYEIKIIEQNPHIDDVMIQNIFHNILFQYIVLKGYLEDEEDRKLPTPLKQRKRKLKPKVIKEFIEEIVDDYDIPDLEIRKVLIEELTKEQLMLEEAEERRRLVEEAEERRRIEEETRKKIEAEEAERKRQEEEAEAERLRLEQEDIERQQRIKELEQKLADERRFNLYNAEIEYFRNHLYDRLDQRSQLLEETKDSEEVQDYANTVKDLEEQEFAELLALELEQKRIRQEKEAEEERIRVRLEEELLASDKKVSTPFLDEVRYFQVNLAMRRHLREEQKREDQEFQEMILREKALREIKVTKQIKKKEVLRIMKTSAKLMSSVILMIVSLTLMVSVSFAWLTLSDSPAVTGIKITIGGDNTILMANDTVVNVDGKEVHIPGYFSKNTNLDIKDVLLSPVSTADGVNWFYPTISDEGEMVVTSLNDFKHDSEYKLRNSKDGGYAYVDFWIVSPMDNTFLRISSGDKTGEEVGSYAVQLPEVKKEGETTVLNTSVDALASSIRVGFLVDDETITEDLPMKTYAESISFREEMTALKGVYETEKVTEEEDDKEFDFLIYEPNGLSHPRKGVSTYLTNHGVTTSIPYEGEYWVTSPIGFDDDGEKELKLIASNLIVQTENTWKISDDLTTKIIQEFYQAYLATAANPTLEGFYEQFESTGFSQYVVPGRFFEDTWQLYLSGNLTRTTAEQLSVLTQTNAVSNNYIVHLRKNIPQRIRMYVWIEGQDVDCTYYAADQTLSLRLEFAGSTGA